MKQIRTNEVAMWLNELSDWDAFLNVTFRKRTGLHEARLRVREALTKGARHASAVLFYERNPSGDGGFHAHGLASLESHKVRRDVLWKCFFGECGRTLIEPPKSRGDVLGYCAKYCSKDAAWFDLFNVPPKPPRG
jgi:hypothetical protein